MVKRKKINKDILTSISRYINRIKLEKIPIHSAVLFGSWAKGKNRIVSDIDLCIVSSEFGKDEIGELQYLLKKTRGVDDRLEPIPVSIQDFENNSTPLIVEIKSHGIVIPV